MIIDYTYIFSLFFLISIIIFFFVSKISYKLNLVDKPNWRKTHLKATAYTGGVALCLTYILSICLFKFHDPKLDIILSMASLIGLVGFIDDRYNLNVSGKLSLQVFPIIYLISLQNLNLIQLGDYNYLQTNLGSFSIPFTVICVIFLINAFNYFDGLDGTLSIISLSTICILLFIIPDDRNLIFLIVVAIPLIIFLFFNFSIFKIPKLFLGDSGSLLLGFIISFTLIYLSNEKIIHPILLAWSISIFVYEFISVNLERLIKKKKIFKPGSDHLHYIFLKKTNSLFLTNFYLVNLNLLFFFTGYFSFYYFNSITSLFLFIIVFFIFFFSRRKLK